MQFQAIQCSSPNVHLDVPRPRSANTLYLFTFGPNSSRSYLLCHRFRFIYDEFIFCRSLDLSRSVMTSQRYSRRPYSCVGKF